MYWQQDRRGSARAHVASTCANQVVHEEALVQYTLQAKQMKPGSSPDKGNVQRYDTVTHPIDSEARPASF